MPYKDLAIALQGYTKVISVLDHVLMWRLDYGATIDTDAWMTFGDTFSGLLTAISDVALNKDPTKFWRAHRNPSSLGTSKGKIVQHKKTPGGFEITHGGNDAVVLDMKFETGLGYEEPSVLGIPIWKYGLMGTEFSIPVLNLTWFEDFYDASHRDSGLVRMILMGKKYDGYLSDFRKEKKADQYFLTPFSVKFTAIPESIFALSTLILSEEFTGSIYAASGIASMTTDFMSLFA